MAQALSVDWSWGEALKTSAFSSERELNNVAPLAHAVPPTKDLYANGFTINEFRTAIPSPSTHADMSDLSLTRASVPRPVLEQLPRKESFAGRKRSCAEMSSDDDSNSPASIWDDASASPTKQVRLEEQEHDAMDATDGSGMWAEELSARLRSTSFPDGSLRPRLPESRKSARVEPEEELMAPDEAGTMVVDGEEGVVGRGRARTRSDHDEARLALGVGWSSIPASPVMLAAARGWTRFIETAFALRNVKIVWRNEGMQVILISAVTSNYNAQGMQLGGSPGYYLLDEALTQGRLVARSWEKCLDLLRAQPIQFESDVTLHANPDQGAAEATPIATGMALAPVDERPLGMEID